MGLKGDFFERDQGFLYLGRLISEVTGGLFAFEVGTGVAGRGMLRVDEGVVYLFKVRSNVEGSFGLKRWHSSPKEAIVAAIS